MILDDGEDHIPHMVPASPELHPWDIPAAIVCAAVALAIVGYLWLNVTSP